MNELLALELETARLPLVDLDVLMLEWVDRLPGHEDERPEMWLRHARGLASSLDGALSLLRDVFKGGAWMVGSPCSYSTLYRAYIQPAGWQDFVTAEAPNEACALCAAIVRAEAEMQARRSRAASAEGVEVAA